MHKKLLLAILGLLLLAGTVLAQGTDNCKDIIPLGFYNKTAIHNSGNHVNDLRNWARSDQLEVFVRKQYKGFVLKVPIKGVTLSLTPSSTKDEFKRAASFIEKESAAHINNAFANSIFSQVVDKNVLAAWSKCMSERTTKTGLVYSYEGNPEEDDFFTVIISWAPRLNVNAAVLEAPSVVGVAYYDSNILREGRVITTEPLRIPVLREGSAGIIISIALKDSMGSLVVQIPPKGQEYRSEKVLKFQGGQNYVQTEPGFPGNINIEEKGGAVKFDTDEKVIGSGFYAIPVQVSSNTQWLELQFTDIQLSRSQYGGNTTLLNIFLSRSEQYNPDEVIHRRPFETSDAAPLTRIDDFTIKKNIAEYKGQTIYLIIMVRDAWDQQSISITINEPIMIQRSEKS